MDLRFSGEIFREDFLPMATAFRRALSEIRPHHADFGGTARVLIVQKLEDGEEQAKD